MSLTTPDDENERKKFENECIRAMRQKGSKLKMGTTEGKRLDTKTLNQMPCYLVMDTRDNGRDEGHRSSKLFAACVEAGIIRRCAADHELCSLLLNTTLQVLVPARSVNTDTRVAILFMDSTVAGESLVRAEAGIEYGGNIQPIEIVAQLLADKPKGTR